MWNHTVAKALLAACFAWSGWTWLGERPIVPVDGEIAAAEPRQVEPSSDSFVQIGRWVLTPRAGYQITARILGHERYRFDELADLIPEDLVLGWGPMSDNRVLQTVDISQSHRFYYWRATEETPIEPAQIMTHSANTHGIRAAGDPACARNGKTSCCDGGLAGGRRPPLFQPGISW